MNFQFDRCYEYPGLRIFFYIINWGSVVLNPIIYVAFQESYQTAIRELLHPRKERKVSQTSMRRVTMTLSSWSTGSIS